MNATDTDPEKIKTALWNIVNSAGVSTTVYTSNRKSVSGVTDFAIVDVNGIITDKAGHARCICMVQMFAKDIDEKGTENMTKLSSMYASLLAALPYNSKPYTFSKRNQVGRRDMLGFHATIVNLDCLIY